MFNLFVLFGKGVNHTMNKKLAVLGALVAVALTATAAQAAVRVSITQDANVNQSSTANADTGDNSQYKKTNWSLDTLHNGNQIITTGDADATSNALSVVNKVATDIRTSVTRGLNGGCSNHGGYGGWESLGGGWGGNCGNEEDECACADVDVEVESSADVDNHSTADAETGYNRQKSKLDNVEVADQNGVQDILTGDATSESNSDQYTNTNELGIRAEVLRLTRAGRE